MTRKTLFLFAASGSLALLLGAYVFQALGYAPCTMCLWQRWPHWAAVATGGLVLILGPLALLGVAGALAAITTAGLGVFHTGVEQGWWEGPSACTGGGNSLDGLSGADLLSLDAPVDIVRCDDVAWAFAGLSMASWNAVLAYGLALIWVWGITRKV